MSELVRDKHDLAPMMALMSDEIGQHMPHVKRQVAPCIRRRRRNSPVPLEPQGQQAGDPAAATFQARTSWKRVTRCRSTAGGTAIPCGCPRSYRHAVRIVDMASEHPKRAPRRTRDSSVPQCGGELFDQEGRDAVVRGPSLQNAAMKWRSPGLHGPAPNVLTPNDPALRPVVVQLSRLLLRDRPFQSVLARPASQEIGGVRDASSVAVQNVGVDHRGSNVVVAQRPLILMIDGEAVKQSLARRSDSTEVG